MPQDALETVVLRNNFYRDNYRRMTTFCLLMIGICAALIGFMYFMYITRPTPTYFATTTDGALIQITPLSQPNMTTNTLLQWATQAATAAYTFNFVDYQQALQGVRTNFTATGYQNFLEALKASDNLNAVIDKKLVVSAVPTNTPVILQEGLAGSVYAWRVQLPMLVSYQSANEVIRQDIILTMLITRVPTLESPHGIGIAQFIVEEGRQRGAS